MKQSTLASSQYHAGVIQTHQARDRLVGRPHQLHLQPAVGQPVRAGQLLLERAGHPATTTRSIPWSEYFNPDAEYGRSLLDSPHKLVGEPDHPPAVRRRTALADERRLDQLGVRRLDGLVRSSRCRAGSRLASARTPTTHNLLGAGAAAEPGAGSDSSRGRAASPIACATNPDRQSLPQSELPSRRRRPARSAMRRAFSTASTRRGATRPTWRSTRSLPLGGSRRATIRLEVINLFDNPWYAALASSRCGNANFGRVTAQANYSRTLQFTARFSF